MARNVHREALYIEVCVVESLSLAEGWKKKADHEKMNGSNVIALVLVAVPIFMSSKQIL